MRLEVENEWAWCGDERLELTSRTFAVLRHLVGHPERLVTKDELFTAIWPDTVVSEAALASCIRDLRRALADDSRTPRYIETVHRRGFRFIGPIGPPATATTRREPSHPTLVGREPELARLHALYETAVHGERRLVFVTGEPGIGKTALVEAFLAELDGGSGLCIGRGQCVEHYGAGEAYLPVLEALGRLGREARGDELVRVLRQYAPTWLAELPALLSDQDLAAVQRRVETSTRDRMLRELSEEFDALSADVPLVLVLEDLHWSDSATVDLLAMLARRRDPARLLVVATYRPADVAAGAHPLRSLKQELQVHRACEELALDFLGEAAVATYLAARFPRASFPPRLARVLRANTSGNPLFLTTVIDDLIAQGRVRDVGGRWELTIPVDDVASEVPHTLSQMVEKQIERLTPEEQAILAVASVAGAEFSTAISTADGIDASDADRCCEALARRGQFLRASGVAEWPDGTIAGRYAFIHTSYRNVLDARIPIGHRVGLHLRIGARLEAAYGPRAGEIAGALAMHFEHGRDFERAVEYHRHAADASLRHHGYREAAEHATRALESLTALPSSRDRMRRELGLRIALGSALTAVKGHAAREVEETYTRARELCEQLGDESQLFPVLVGLGRFHLVRGASGAARDVGEQLAHLSQAPRDPTIGLAAHNILGLVGFYAGEFESARSHLEQGIAAYDPAAHSPDRSPVFRGGRDTGVSCMAHHAWTLWVLGYPARAATGMREALALARSIAHPLSMAHAYRLAAGFHLSRRDPHAVREHEDAAFAISTEHGFSPFLMAGKFHRGWLLVGEGHEEEGLAQMWEAVAAWRQMRAETPIPAYLAWFADVHLAIGRAAEGLALVSEALAAGMHSGHAFWTAELHRLKGDLVLRSASGPDAARAERQAEACYVDAMEIARRQSAKAFELRAALSLGRLWRRQGEMQRAHRLVSDVYGWFTEGFETADLRDASVLLGQLGSAGQRAAPARQRRSGRRSDRPPSGNP